MKELCIAMTAIFGLPLLQACTTPQTQGKAWTIEPVFSVRNATEKPEAHYRLGRYHEGQDRFDLAIRAYRKALVLDEKYAEAHNALGAVYARQGKLDEAIAEFRLAIALAPEHAHFHNNLGYAHYLAGRHGDAVGAFEQATRLEPGNRKAWNNLGLALAKLGETTKATAAFSRALVVDDAAQPGPSNEPARAASTGARGDGLAPVQTLALPKDRGVIQPSRAGTAGQAASNADSPVHLVQVAEHVYELKRTAAPAPVEKNRTVSPAEARSNPVSAFRLEIANGNGITGMARQVGQMLARQGLPAARLTNHKPFNQQATEIQYREGFDAQAAHIVERLPSKPALVKSTALRANTDVRLVLGRDMPQGVLVQEPRQDARPAAHRVAAVADPPR